MTQPADESTVKSAPRTIRLPMWLVAVGGLALLTHGAANLANVDERILSPDEQEYVALAQSIVDDGRLLLPSGDAAKRMPLYPAFLSLFYATQESKYWLIAAQIGQALLALISTLGIAAIAARLCNDRAGLLAGIIAALYAPFLHLQNQMLTECLAIFLLVVALWLYVAKCLGGATRVDMTVAPWGVSLLLGLSLLTRANAVLLLIPFALHAGLFRPPGTRRGMRVVALLLPALLMTGAWMARNQSVVGSFTPSTIGGLNFFLGHNPDFAGNAGMSGSAYNRYDELRQTGMSELEADRQLYDQGWRFIREHPGETVANFGRKLKVWFTPTTQSFGPSILLIAAGFVVAAYWQRGIRDHRSAMPRMLVAFATAAIIVAYAAWCRSNGFIPFASPLYLLPVGIPCLLFARFPSGTKWLLIGIVLSQLAVALVYIPLSRLRWSIDAVFIVAVAVACSQLCGWIDRRQVAV